jgi:hypothetical protein
MTLGTQTTPFNVDELRERLQKMPSVEPEVISTEGDRSRNRPFMSAPTE